jgi:hypothetical protein
MTDPQLNILVLPTYSAYTLGVADLSVYPENFNIVSPTLQIIPQAFSEVAVNFSARGMVVLNAQNLGLMPEGSEAVKLPDGIYRLRYSVHPAYQYFVEKTFMRVEQLQERFDEAFLRADLIEGTPAVRRFHKEQLDEIYFTLQEAVAAANQCATTLATNLYQRAETLLDRYLHTQTHCC